MKVAFVCCEYPPGPHGGIGASTQNLARGLVQSGHEVRVVGVYARGYPTPTYEEDRGVRIWRLRRWGAGRSWILDRYRLFRFIARWAKAGQLDLIDVPDYQGWAAGWPRLAVPVISRWCLSASCRSAEIGRRVDLTTFHLERMSLRRADFSCAKSAYLGKRTQEVFRLPFGPQEIVYNPVEIRTCLPEKPRALHRVVFAGTLSLSKGIVSLIRAWPMVTKVHPYAELHVFGKDGRSPLGASMQAYLVDQMAPQQRTSVRLHGHVEREVLLQHLTTARVAIFPSYSEGFANAPLEAMACGCPTIVSSRTCGPEMVRDGLDGLTIDPDSPGQIAQAILHVLRNDELARRLSHSGLRRVQENFSLPAVTARNEEFYRQCLHEFHAVHTTTSA